MSKHLENRFQKHLADSGLHALPSDALDVMRLSFYAGAMAAIEIPQSVPVPERGRLAEEVAFEVIQFGQSIKGRKPR